MTRSLVRYSGVALVIALGLVAAPAAVRAAEPDPVAFVQAAEDAGLPCTDFGSSSWMCTEPIDSMDDRAFDTFIEARDDGSFQANITRSWADVRPVEADVLALMDRYILLAVGEDSEAREWLATANDERLDRARLDRGDWDFSWRADWEDPGDTLQPIMQLSLLYSPTAAGSSDRPSVPASLAGEPISASPPASAGPVPNDAAAPARIARNETFADSIPTALEISTDPTVILQSALLAALIVFLMPFPGQLFNSTLEEHENEVRAWLRLDRGGAARRIGAFWASWPGIALFILLIALLYAFLDPNFGFDVRSVATLLGMMAGIVLVTVAFAIPSVVAHRRVGDGFTIKVVPISLLVGVACVLISRITGFQPGYLYGLLIGLAFARELSAAVDGRVATLGAVVMLAVSLSCWLALGAMPEGDAFGVVVGRTALAALMVGGLEGVVFGLLPVRFLPGEPLYRWNRAVWGALLLAGAFAFFHILVNPASGYLADSSRTPLLTLLALLIGFALVSVAFWAWFRYRPSPKAAVLDPENN